jgi:hypothetical protein
MPLSDKNQFSGVDDSCESDFQWFEESHMSKGYLDTEAAILLIQPNQQPQTILSLLKSATS